VALGALGLATGGSVLGTAAHAQAMKLGVMACDMDGSFGHVFGSSRNLHCISSATCPLEHYADTISKFGLDIGYVRNAVIVWTVVAPTVSPPRGSLAGTYGGAGASGAVGLGVGANVLVGGSNDMISLQPISIEGGTGLNVSGGLALMSLNFQPR
jgi:hypothetical protein